MANSRLERLGTIYTRVSGLLRAGAMKEEDKPMWYNIYKAFPPEKEPRIDHPVPVMNIKQIFYLEDSIRAKFHKSQKFLRTVKLSDCATPTETQQLISIYNKLNSERKDVNEDQLFEEAVDVLKAENTTVTDSDPRVSRPTYSIVDSFTEAKKRDASENVNIKDIFKE